MGTDPLRGRRGARRAMVAAMATIGLQFGGLAAAAVARADTSYDLATIAGGYDNTTPPDGAFTYDEVANATQLTPSTYLSVIAPFIDPSGAGGGLPGYAGTEVHDGYAYPQFLTNATDSAFVGGLAFAPAHSFYFHPGNSLAGVMDFTVPGGGAANLSAAVTLTSRNTCNCGDVVGYLFAADSTGTIIGSAPTAVERSSGNVATLSLPSTAVPAGGHVYLVIDDNGDYGSDGTGIAETVTQNDSAAASLPEAGLAVSLPLAASAVIGVAVLRRRRTRP